MSKTRMAHTLFALAVASLAAACSLIPTRTSASVDTPPAATPVPADSTALLVAMARVDLAARLDVGIDQTALQRLEPTEFPDASLGVPEPGQVYAQVVTAGYIIELVAGGQTYIYHASGERVVAAPTGQALTDRITIQSVRVTAAEVVVSGSCTLPAGTCVNTELWVGRARQAWWPAGACASMEGGAWELVVPLDGERALQPSVEYEVRAYQAGGPDIIAAFLFDLDGPPSPGGTLADDPTLLLPDAAEVILQATGDLDGDGLAELVFLAGFGGYSDDLSYDSLRLYVLAPSADAEGVAGYELVWQSDALFGERAGSLTLQDINGDGRLEVLCLQSMGASGQALQVFAWSADDYRLLRPVGGRFDGLEYFGEKGVRLVDLDGDGIVEVLGAYGPAASASDVYAWDGQAYVHRRAPGEQQTQAGYVRVHLTDVGMSFEVPADWIEGPSTVWTAAGDDSLRLGVKWVDLQPPQEPEAALLPQPAQILESESVALTWGSGRRFTLEVYGEAVEGGGQAPVESVETHVLVVIERKGGRRAFDVYVSARNAEQLAGLEDVLAHALASVVLE